MAATAGPSRGERATDFVLPLGLDGQKTRFYALAGGKATVLMFLQAYTVGRAATLAQSCGPADVFAVCRDAAPTEAPCPVFHDATAAVSSAYRLEGQTDSVLLVLDANLRVLGSVLSGHDKAQQNLQALLAEAQPQVVPVTVEMQAPVLLIPHVLAPEICEFLQQVWHNQGHVETGVEQTHGMTRAAGVDHSNKSRRDHVVEDGKLLKMLSTTVGRHVMSEVQRAFAYRATRFEGFKIACYDAESEGFFHAHRDNLSPTTAHRRFALSVNINDDYDGGYLRFPEFGPHLYRPAAGGAVVFSCAHLHEVTPVTRGRRFALLSFLFGAEGVPQSP